MEGSGVLRRIHLTCGLVMLAYVTCHLVNHGLGVVSLAAMDAARPYLVRVWTNAAGTVVLAAAALIHIALALWTTARRRSLAMPAWQSTQLVLGLSIPCRWRGPSVPYVGDASSRAEPTQRTASGWVRLRTVTVSIRNRERSSPARELASPT